MGVVALYADKHHISYIDALSMFYHSKTYQQLELESTKYWHLGPVALCEDFEEDNAQKH